MLNNINVSLHIQLSPYNYERIEVVLKILQAADENVPGFSVVQVRQSFFGWLICELSC